MEQTILQSEPLEKRAMTFYEAGIREKVEKEENIGKLLSIDVETGDYEMDNDPGFNAIKHLRSKNPQAKIFTLRIGYDAVYALGGVLERTSR